MLPLTTKYEVGRQLHYFEEFRPNVLSTGFIDRRRCLVYNRDALLILTYSLGCVR